MTVLYTRWRFDSYTQDQEPNFTYQNFLRKFRETLLTSKLHSAEFLSFWRDFSQKIQKIPILVCVALRRHLVSILGIFVVLKLIFSYSLQTVLHLLIGSLVSNSSLADCRANDAALLQLFLESYFMDVIDASNPADNSIILDGDQLQALHTLVRSYLTSLSVPVRFEEKNIDCNMFGSRFLYLDLLPPFKSTNVKDTMMNTDSPEFWCQNSLLKLQSLLCSNLCKGASCKSIVQGYLDIKPDTIGHMSLKILCLDDAKSSIPLLVDHHPEVLMPFAKEHNVDQGTYTVPTSFRSENIKPGKIKILNFLSKKLGKLKGDLYCLARM